MKSLLRPLPALAALALPLSASAGGIILTGDTTGAPTFNRPTVTGALSSQTVSYQAYVFTVSQNGLYDFTLSSPEDPMLYDPFLHLYQGSFNPTDPETGFFRANDDSAAGGTSNSALANVLLTSASTYYLVADGLTSLDYGAYTATVTGPGNVSASAVPEPSTLALGGVFGGAFAVLMLRRRRRGMTAA